VLAARATEVVAWRLALDDDRVDVSGRARYGCARAAAHAGRLLPAGDLDGDKHRCPARRSQLGETAGFLYFFGKSNTTFVGRPVVIFTVRVAVAKAGLRNCSV
jgi:hypothetical protein